MIYSGRQWIRAVSSFIKEQLPVPWALLHFGSYRVPGPPASKVAGVWLPVCWPAAGVRVSEALNNYFPQKDRITEYKVPGQRTKEKPQLEYRMKYKNMTNSTNMDNKSLFWSLGTLKGNGEKSNSKPGPQNGTTFKNLYSSDVVRLWGWKLSKQSMVEGFQWNPTHCETEDGRNILTTATYSQSKREWERCEREEFLLGGSTVRREGVLDSQSLQLNASLPKRTPNIFRRACWPCWHYTHPSKERIWTLSRLPLRQRLKSMSRSLWWHLFIFVQNAPSSNFKGSSPAFK